MPFRRCPRQQCRVAMRQNRETQLKPTNVSHSAVGVLRRDGPGRASGTQSLRGSTKAVRRPRFLAAIRPADRAVDVFDQLS